MAGMQAHTTPRLISVLLQMAIGLYSQVTFGASPQTASVLNLMMLHSVTKRPIEKVMHTAIFFLVAIESDHSFGIGNRMTAKSSTMLIPAVAKIKALRLMQVPLKKFVSAAHQQEVKLQHTHAGHPIESKKTRRAGTATQVLPYKWQ